ncbi:hypothetical protein ACFFQF_22380 [Haladaptatus pallidirubidus]|uniref:hypothetical protein n=1 Tax=Haladaptatus pallidirubidus TaxID=1008152 RepID=UPI001D1160D9|nr:hypothetical protein [Haladaptatus pallidirubidus]
MIARKSELFKGKYVGQFIIVAVAKERQVRPEVVSTCNTANWRPKKTRVYDSVFVDHLGNSTQSIRTDIFTDGTKSKIEVGQPFIINEARSCTDKYIVLEAESVPTYAATGEPRGPTATPR